MVEDVQVVAYGRPASRALAAAVGRAKAAAGPLGPVTVIVPSNLAGLTARRLLAEGIDGQPGGLANVAFVTPFQLVEVLAADRLLDRRPLTNPVLGSAVRAALREAPGPFAPVADHHATEAALAALYAELANVSPAALDRLEAAGGSSAAAAVRMHRTVRSQLTGFHDEADVARAVATRPDLEAALAPLGRIVWYLPAPLTVPLADALARVLATAPAAVVAGLTGDDESDAAVRATCARAGVTLPPGDVAPPTASRVVSTSDADEEVRAVVRSVVALVEAGVRLDRIAIFYPTADPYLSTLEQQLAEAELPANGPIRRRLADTVAGRTLLAALALPGEQFRRDRVLALVSGGPVRSPDGGAAHPSAWEHLSRRAGVVQGLDDWRSKLAARRARLDGVCQPGAADRGVDEEDQARRIERARRDQADIDALAAFVDGLAGHLDRIERAPSWAGKAAAASSLLHELLGPGHHHDRWPEGEQLAFERVEDALSRLAALDEIEPSPTQAVFLRALAAELDVARGRSGRFGHGVVYGPLASAAGHDLDAVFVVGCVEGICPTPRREDGLLPDAARALTDGELTPRRHGLHEQHRCFLAALAAAPPGARTLTMARGDLRADRQALPSRWLLESVSAQQGRPVFATDFLEHADELADVVPSFVAGLVAAPTPMSVAERDLGALARHVAVAGTVDGHPVAARVARGLEVQRARRSPAFTEWDGNLAGQPIRVADEQPQSASRLETWAACGFRYFLAHVLGLADRDDPERVVELGTLDRGSGVHQVLERFVAEAIAEGPPAPDQPWSPAQRARLHAIADEVFAEYERRGRTGRPLLWRLAKDGIRAVLESFLAADDAHRAAHRALPEAAELAFGLEGTEPVVVRLPSGRELRFRGYADRIDRTEDDRLLVFDYKTGKPDKYRPLLDGDPVQAGTTLQLGLYSEAARQQLGADAVEAWYWMLDGDGRQRFGYPWTDDRRQRLVEVVAAVIGGIEAGSFPAVPGEWDTWRGTHEACAWCAFDSVCPRDRGEQAEAKVGAPELRHRDALAWEAAP